MAIAVERKIDRKPNFYTLCASKEASLPKEEIKTNPHFRKLVNICLNTCESSPLQLYENGHEPHTFSTTNNQHYFAIDVENGKRTYEIPADQVEFIPDHTITEDGQIIGVKSVAIKGNIEYWQVGPDGKLILTEKPSGSGNKPEKIGVKVDPTNVIKKNYIDKFTGMQVIALSDRELLREEITELASFHFSDLLQAPETEASVQKWLDILEAVPDIIKLLSHESSYVEAVQKSHVLNIASVAMQIAANPETKIKIVSGFGASNTERSNCYVTNALPALEMADRMISYFEQRKTKGKNSLNNTPTVELVFAQEAGIQVNYQDEPESVRTKTADNIAYVQNFARELYPKVPLKVTSDIAWSNLSPLTEQVIRYYASILRHHPSKDIENTLGNLVKFGYGKGSNGSSKDTAAEYAAIHPLVWGLKPSFAEVQYLKDETPADIVIRIGPRAEIKFDAMIMTIKRWESATSFEEFIRTDSHSLNEPLIHHPSMSYKERCEPTTVLLISRVGRQGPTYFKYPYDDSPDSPPEETKIKLEQEINALTDQMAGQSNLSELAERRSSLKSRVTDLDILLAIRNSRQHGGLTRIHQNPCN